MKNFRTIRVSDPRFESNNLRFFTVKTPDLRGRGDCCVFAPPLLQADSSCPLIILLHGVYGSAWSWPLCTGVHLKVAALINEGKLPPMVIAMPSDGLWGDGSAYLPHNEKNFENWIAEDIPEVIQQIIPAVTEESPLCISGLSMGGFGALRIGAKYGKKFSAIAAHSAITSLSQMSLFVEEDLANYKQEDEVDEDVFKTIFRYRDTLPPVYFDCGKDDLLISYNRELHRQLKENGITHRYEEFEGEHQWNYWEEHIMDSLFFFRDRLSEL
ncbi:MAG: alpha/beta hydrolase-fold protein [Chitinophagaceae bacterium]